MLAPFPKSSDDHKLLLHAFARRPHCKNYELLGCLHPSLTVIGLPTHDRLQRRRLSNLKKLTHLHKYRLSMHLMKTAVLTEEQLFLSAITRLAQPVRHAFSSPPSTSQLDIVININVMLRSI